MIRLLTRLPVLLALPATILHEATHAAVLVRYADRWGYVLGWDDASFRYDLDDECPRWVAVLGALAPTVVGFGTAAVVSAWWLANGGRLPDTGISIAKLALAGVVWAIYTAPSPRDLAEVKDA